MYVCMYVYIGPMALSEHRLPQLAIHFPMETESQATAPSKGRPRVAARHDSAEAVGGDGLGILRAGTVEEVMPWLGKTMGVEGILWWLNGGEMVISWFNGDLLGFN